MSRRGRTVLRFAVVDDLGRSSEIWRIWTGKKRPTNDAYLAPRPQASDLKVSLHESGECRIGPTGPLRDRLAGADRYALDVWQVDPQGPPPRALIAIQFHRSELIESEPHLTNVEAIRIPPGSDSLMVLILIGDPAEVTPTEDIRVDVLDRAGEESLLVVSLPCDPRPDLLEEAKRSLRQHELTSWTLPVAWPESPLGWMVTDGRDTGPDAPGCPLLLELHIGVHPSGDSSPDLEGLSIQALPWEQFPGGAPDDPSVCAILLAPGPTEDGEAVIFANGHARCDHRNLGATAEAVIRDFRSSGPDSGWSQIIDGDWWYTSLVTRDEAPVRGVATGEMS